MSSSDILIDAPTDLPSATFEAEIVSRLEMVAQKDPQALIEKLQEHMKSERTQVMLKQRASKSLDAIRVIRDTFTRATDLLSKVDANHFNGADGKPIKKLKPEWDSLRKIFNDNLLKTEGLAIAANGSIDSFVKGILPLLNKKGMEFATESQNIDFIESARSVEKSICHLKDLIKSYQVLSENITFFRRSFVGIMETVGQRLDDDIKNAEANIIWIDESIERHKDYATTLGFLAGVTKATGAAFAATGILAPMAIGLVSVGLFANQSFADEYFIKLKELEEQRDEMRKKLDDLTAKRGKYQELDPTGTIGEKLMNLTNICKLVYRDAMKVEIHLKNASKLAQEEDMKRVDIDLMAQSYANIQLILQTFANGWEEATK